MKRWHRITMAAVAGYALTALLVSFHAAGQLRDASDRLDTVRAMYDALAPLRHLSFPPGDDLFEDI